jgi:hypothetical protein
MEAGEVEVYGKPLREWTTEELKREARALYSAIYSAECCGPKDLQLLDLLLAELARRGVGFREMGTLVFDDDENFGGE